MSAPDASYEIFLAGPPGLEACLAEEAASLGFAAPKEAPGGVLVLGDWSEAQRANLTLRGANRVLVRIAAARVTHLAQLDKWARKLPWTAFLRPDQPVRVEAACRRSRLYHSGAVAQRLEQAVAAATGAPIARGGGEEAADDGAADREAPGEAAQPPIRILARIEKNLCVVSLDSSGAPLHRRGFKQAVGKAPLRETLASLCLRRCGHQPGEPLIDPMCGSGTFPLEAAEATLGLAPGRARSFAFERLAGFDAAGFNALKSALAAEARPGPAEPVCFGFDRDAGAVAQAEANAARAGVAAATRFAAQPISALRRPEGPPGLVMVNPPYGARLGETGPLHALYASLGARLREDFAGWRVGLVTSEPALARAARLPFAPPSPPIPHGPLTIRLYRTDPL